MLFVYLVIGERKRERERLKPLKRVERERESVRFSW
jgi:hypothetical protein